MAKAKVRPSSDASPSNEVIRSAHEEAEEVSNDGRVIRTRKLSPRRRMQVFAGIGPELSQNQQYWGTAMLAAAVVAIDGETITPPNTRREIEALVERLGDDGLLAAGRALGSLMGVEVDEDGNVIKDNDEKDIAKN